MEVTAMVRFFTLGEKGDMGTKKGGMGPFKGTIV